MSKAAGVQGDERRRFRLELPIPALQALPSRDGSAPHRPGRSPWECLRLSLAAIQFTTK